MGDEKVVLKDIKCPKCGNIIKGGTYTQKSAQKYEDCYRKCQECSCAVSNAQEHPTYIYLNYMDNLLKDNKDDKLKLEEIFKNVLNKRNRKNKINKFGYSSSEDAFSWIFFSYFLKHDKLQELSSALNIKEEIKDILFWGVPYKQSEFGKSIRDILINKENERKENDKSRTEPDIIIVTEHKIVFIEVKLKSGMPEQKKEEQYKNDSYFDKEYYCSINEFNSLKDNGYLYELIRNWTLCNDIALEKKLSPMLYNLIPNIAKKEEDSQKKFTATLIKSDNYKVIKWKDLFSNLRDEKINCTSIEERFEKLINN